VRKRSRAARFRAEGHEATNRASTDSESAIRHPQSAHLERRLKTGRVRIQDLDKVAPRLSYSSWKMSLWPGPVGPTRTVAEALPEDDGNDVHSQNRHRSDSSVSSASDSSVSDVHTRRESSPIIFHGSVAAIQPLETLASSLCDKKQRLWYAGCHLCVVCQDGMDDDAQVRELRCGHVFHASCIEPWLTTCHSLCPVCRNHVRRIPQLSS
jgi:hypothetical protein